jgi:hypothetical protein
LFVVLFILSGAAIGINLMFNLRQQLTAVQLATARSQWAKHGLANYDMTIRKEISAAGSDRAGIKDVLVVSVRDRKTIGVTVNGQPLERRLWSEYDVEGVFDWIERFLEIDSQAGAARTFCIAMFDQSDGHPVRYVRSKSSTRERQELNIELKRVN